MEKQVCDVCLKNKTAIKCDECQCASCKKCSEFTMESFEEIQEMLPENLKAKVFCPNCYMNKYESQFNDFYNTYLQAKDVKIYEKKLSAETRLIPRLEPALSVKDCADERDVMMRLAFEAASKGFNSLLDVEFKSTKSRDGSYKFVVWSGSGVPANVDRRR